MRVVLQGVSTCAVLCKKTAVILASENRLSKIAKSTARLLQFLILYSEEDAYRSFTTSPLLSAMAMIFCVAALVSGSHDMRFRVRTCLGYLLREISKYTADVI